MADQKESKPAEPSKAKKDAPPKKATATDPSKPLEPKVQHIGGESIIDRLLPHLKKIIMSAIILAVLLSIYFGWKAWTEHKEVKQTERLVAVLDVGTRPILPPNLPPDPKRPPGFANEKERAAAALDEITKRDAGTAAGHAYHGGLLLDAGKVDEAIAELRKAQAAPGVDGVLARENLGIALETKAAGLTDAAAKQKGYEEALQAFVAMQRDPAGPRYAYALYHQGRINQTMQKFAEAKALYEKAKELGKGTELPALIEMRLVSLEGA